MADGQASAKEWALFCSVVLCGYLPKQADAIFVHAQDDLKDELLERVAELYFDLHPNPKIVLNGLAKYENKENPSGYKEWRRDLYYLDVKLIDILKIPEARHTGEEAIEIVKLCEDNGWKKLIIAATPQHLARCFLTILGVLEMRRINLSVYCLTVPNSDWHGDLEKYSVIQGSVIDNRFGHFKQEFNLIRQYRYRYLSGDHKITPLISVKSALDYLKNRSK